MGASVSTSFMLVRMEVTGEPPVATGTFPNSASEQQVLFPSKSGRFIRVRALTEVYGLAMDGDR